jgi:Zn-dependent protease
MHQLADLFIWYLVFVFSTTCHEASHALVAYLGGDPTAYSGGHVTLDPLPHIRRSPIGMVVVPVLTFLLNNGWMIGWASVPVNPTWTRAHPRRAALMALCGPLANLTLALIAFFAMRWLLGAGLMIRPFELSFSNLVILPPGANPHSPLGAVARFLSIMLMLNVVLGLFNLIPFPPLDGAVVAEGAVPSVGTKIYDRLREVPAFELLGLLVSWRLFDYVASPALSWVIRQLYS